MTISGGELTFASGGGSGSRIDESLSAKGIKGLAKVEITGGTFTIDSADDAVHSNNAIVIQGGTFTIATGDDAMHADTILEVNGGDIRVTQSYEGLESAALTINGGDINIVSGDGIDINSAVEMTDGVLIVNGPIQKWWGGRGRPTTPCSGPAGYLIGASILMFGSYS